MIYKHKQTKLDSSKYCYVSLKIQLNISHLFTHSSMTKQFYFKQLKLIEFKFKWFHVLLRITKHSIKYQSYMYAQLDDKTVLFQATQISKSILFALSLNVRQFYLTHS